MNNWDLIAEQYNKLVGDTGDIYHKVYINPLILKILGNIKNKKVLDLACGKVIFLETLRKMVQKLSVLITLKN